MDCTHLELASGKFLAILIKVEATCSSYNIEKIANFTKMGTLKLLENETLKGYRDELCAGLKWTIRGNFCCKVELI